MIASYPLEIPHYLFYVSNMIFAFKTYTLIVGFKIMFGLTWVGMILNGFTIFKFEKIIWNFRDVIVLFLSSFSLI